ncbi:tyrosine-type recombinase/integrase [Micromonospora sp. NPDC007230]|uniref:tyrosine-type recombinase/integrase n=1 Tax=Micromonospora sp. NPDC007230 TaxID=3364237 RepID=UPI003677656E
MSAGSYGWSANSTACEYHPSTSRMFRLGGPDFAALREAAGCPDVRLHDLRHTVVSLLMDLGVPPHVVQAVARHADVKITLKIHSHANLDVMRQALGKLDGRLS